MFTLHFIGGAASGEQVVTEHKPATIVTMDEPTGIYDYPVYEHKYGLWVEDGERLYYRPEQELREIANYADDGEL